MPGPKHRRAGAVASVPAPPTIQVFTTRDPGGALCQILQVSDGAGAMRIMVQLGEAERSALARTFAEPLSDIVVAQAGDLPTTNGGGSRGGPHIL